MRYNSDIEHNKSINTEIQRAVGEHLTGYMEQNDLCRAELSRMLNIPQPDINKLLFGPDNNFTIKRLIHIGLKTGKKLVIKFEDI